MDHLRRLVAHLAWADARVGQAMGEAGALDSACLERYAHILGAEHTWLSRLLGQPARLPVWPSLTLEECASLARENAAALADYVAALGPDDLNRGITYTNSAGAAFTSTVEDILLQIFLHGHYHRGQIALELRQQGAVPSPTDYIAFTRGAPAARRVS
jgi:uncharacterized damage-inducible protein DinB